MFLLDTDRIPSKVKTFECELISLELEERIIKYKFEPVVVIKNIRQCCKIKKSKEEKKGHDEFKNPDSIIKKKQIKPISIPQSSDDYLEEEEIIFSQDVLTNKSNKTNISTNNSSIACVNQNFSESKNLNQAIKEKRFNKNDYKDIADIKDYDDYTESNHKNNDSFILRNTYKKIVFEFKNFPEFVEIGNEVVINEPFMKAYGRVTALEPQT